MVRWRAVGSSGYIGGFGFIGNELIKLKILITLMLKNYLKIAWRNSEEK
jgi:hypothetical protein